MKIYRKKRLKTLHTLFESLHANHQLRHQTLRSKLNKLFMYNSCGGTFADSVFFATYLCILEGKKIYPKDCIGSLETPVVLSQQMLIGRNDACQIILLFCIVLYSSTYFSLRFYSVNKPRDC